MEQKRAGAYEIDPLHLIKVLWNRIWLIAVVGVVTGILAFACARFLVAPQYEANILLYINNFSGAGGQGSTFSSSELNAAHSLVDTYVVILKSRTTLNKVIQKAGVEYDFEELSRMISASSENETEIFRVTVTSEDADEAAKIANTIADVLPDSIAAVVESSSVRVVDYAAVDHHKVSPSFAKWTAVGLMLGAMITALFVVLIDVFDDVIHDEDYLTQGYDIPVLALIPDLTESVEDGYGYYGHDGKSGEKGGQSK